MLKLRNMATIYLRQHKNLLLLYRQGGRVVSDVWVGSAGGHFEADELNDPQACILRELNEEIQLSQKQLTNMKLRYITLHYTKDEIRQNYYFFADLREDISLTSNEGILRWFAMDEVEQLPMPFTSQHVLHHYVQTGQYTDTLYGGVADGTRLVFTELPMF